MSSDTTASIHGELSLVFPGNLELLQDLKLFTIQLTEFSLAKYFTISLASTNCLCESVGGPVVTDLQFAF